MTVIVSVKINDGVVMAADSAGTMGSGQVYAHANKIANLCAGLPVGAMSSGSGGIGNESVETLLKDLRRRFAGLDPAHRDWRLDPEAYTVEEVARRLEASEATRGIPVIALTAHAMAGDREKALEVGCDEYHTKPVQFPRLLAQIEALLGGGEAP